MLGWLLHECPSTHSRPDASTPTQCTARPLGAASKILNDKARRSSQQSRRSNRRSAVATGPAEGRRGLAAPDPLARPTTAARPRGPAPHHRVRAEYPDKSPRAWKMTPVAPPSRPAFKFIFVSANVRIPARAILLLASTKKSFLEGLASISQVSWKDRENLGRTVAAALCVKQG